MHVEIVEITSSLVSDVCTFLARTIHRDITAAEYSPAFDRRWAEGPPGFALIAGQRIVGALATIRSERMICGRARRVCNLSSWAIAPPFRSYGPALLQRAIAARDVVYTNFTASAAVVDVLRAFGFSKAPARERILLPLPARTRRAAHWSVDADAIEATLRRCGRADVAQLIGDHRGTRAKWVLVEHGDTCCAVALQLIHVRFVPFAVVLYCSAPERFRHSLHALQRACRRTWGLHLVAWPEYRFAAAAVPSIAVQRPRPVMFRGEGVEAADLDGLYTELTVLPILR